MIAIFRVGVVTLLSAAAMIELLDLHQLYWETQWVPLVADSSFFNGSDFWAALVGSRLVVGLAVFTVSAVGVAVAVRANERADARALTLCLAFGALFLGAGGLTGTTQLGSYYAYLGPPLVSELQQQWSVSVPILSLALALGALLRFSVLFPRPLSAADLATWRRTKRTEIRQTARRVVRTVKYAGLPKPTPEGPSAQGDKLWPLSLVDTVMLKPAGPWIAAAVLASLAHLGMWLVQSFEASLALDTSELSRGYVMAVGSFAFVAMLGLPLAAVVLSIRYLRISNTIGTSEDRKRLFWVLQGFVVSVRWLVAFFVIYFLFVGFFPPHLFWVSRILRQLPLLSPLILVFCLAFGIFYRGALDERTEDRSTPLNLPG